jgi:hypothetical protein
MNTQEAYKKLMKCIKGKDSYLLNLQLKKEEETLTPFKGSGGKLVISPKDNLGKFFAVPSAGLFGYVNNNPKDSFYLLSSQGKIQQWDLGVNVSEGLKGLSYHWKPRHTTYDITDLVLRSQFTFLNWINRNPMEVKE